MGATGKITGVDAGRSFKGETAQCWALVQDAKDVEAYLTAVLAAGLSRGRARFCLRHFATTLKVVRVG